MNKFWIPYVLLLITGTIAVYKFAPMAASTIAPFVPHWMKPDDPTVATTTFITTRTTGTIVPHGTTTKQIPPQKKEVVPEDDSFVSPALEGIYYARSTEQPEWGVTFQKTACYNAKGAHLGLIDSGQILNCMKNKLVSSKGDLLECQLKNSTNGTVMIARKDAHFFTGNYNKLAAKQIQMLSDYYQLNGKIVERRKKLLEDGANLNPHLSASRSAYVALTKNIEDARQLQQQLSAATDSKKMALDEQLHALKVKEAGLKATFDEAQKKFVEWKTKHASQLPNPETDPVTKAWMADKKKMIPALPGLAF